MKRDFKSKLKFKLIIILSLIIFLNIATISAKEVSRNSIKDRNGDGAVDVRDLILEYNPGIVEGDTNQDGKVDILDLVILGKSYGKSKSLFSKAGVADGNNWDANAELADFNKDGRVDILDLVILGKRFNAKSNKQDSGEVKVFIEPFVSDVDKNQDFSANVRIDSEQEVYGFELNVKFDPSFVSVSSVDEGDFLKKDDAETVNLGARIDNTNGKILFPVSRTMASAGVTGTGVLAKINFRTKDKKGTSMIDLANTKLANPAAQLILGIQFTNGRIDIALHVPVIDSFSPLENPTITEEQQQTFSITDHDRANDIVSEKWFLDGREVAVGKSYTYVADYQSAGIHKVKFVVEDSEQNKAEKEWTLNVEDVDRPPTEPSAVGLTSSPEPAVRNPQLVFTCTAVGSTDPDGNSVSYQYEFTKQGNVVQAFSNNNKFSCPSCIKHEKIQCNAKAVANGLFSNSASSNIIEILNTPPTKPTSVKLEPTSAFKNIKFTCTASGSTDPDGDTLVYHYEFRKNGNVLQIYSTNAEYVCANNCNKKDMMACYSKANDGEVFSDEAKSNSVEIKNLAPVLQEIGNKQGAENKLLNFFVSASDADGDVLTFSAENLPSGAEFINNEFKWTPTLTQAGNYNNIKFKVSDGEAEDSETINIAISDAKPDLFIKKLIVQSPEQPEANKDIIFAFAIKNQGATGTEKNVFWKIETGDGNSKTSAIPIMIGESEEKTIFTKYKYANAGEYTIKVIVDPGNLIGEIEENNNDKTLQINVK